MRPLWGFRRQSGGGSAVRRVLASLVLIGVMPAVASAQYVLRGNTTTSGAITFTGNTLGLDGSKNNNGENGQGTRGGIGTFITTDTTQRDVVPDSGSSQPFPFGTTSDWRLNRSEAILRVPASARIVHAELIWGGTYASNDPDDNVSAFLDDPILF